MGFNKRYLTKDIIISYIKEGGDVNKLIRADSLIMDNWSSNFFYNYDTSNKYNQMRTELKNQFKFSSNLNDILNHKYFPKLKKLSNILENLIRDPSWIEVILVSSFNLFNQIPEEHRGKLDKNREFYIDAIVNLWSGDKINNNILNESK